MIGRLKCKFKQHRWHRFGEYTWYCSRCKKTVGGWRD